MKTRQRSKALCEFGLHWAVCKCRAFPAPNAVRGVGDADGESVILIDKDGVSVIDSLTFESQKTDVSMGRDPVSYTHLTLPTKA